MKRTLLVNGEHIDSSARTLHELIEELASERQVAVAVNGMIVPKSQWSKAELVEGACIDLFESIAGG